MGSEWRVVTLDEVTHEVTVGFVGSMTQEYQDDGIPFLRSKNISPFKINTDDLKYVSPEFNQKIRKSKLKPGDVIIVRTGKPGTCAVIPDWLEEANCSDVVIARCGPDINERYLAYYVNTAASNHVNAHLVGAVQQHFNVSAAKKMEVLLPPLAEQARIVKVLGTIDDKIALNHQINTTLESMAQALFKSWFVDFDPVIDNALAAGNPIPEALQARADARATLGDQRKPLPDHIRQQFPDRFVETEEMGWVPEGWEVEEVTSIIERLKVKKRYKKVDVSRRGRTPVFEQGADILLGYHDHDGEIDATPSDPAFIFGDHTCVTKLSTESFSVSQNVIPLRGTKRNSYWTYYAIRDKQQFEEYRRHWMELAVKKVLLPTRDLANIFADQICTTKVKQAKLSRQNDALAEIRDTLLPKLLSGELRIPEVERPVAEII